MCKSNVDPKANHFFHGMFISRNMISSEVLRSLIVAICTLEQVHQAAAFDNRPLSQYLRVKVALTTKGSGKAD